ncbi:PAS domain-containing protein [Chitinophaga alhagiae]|nr:PAS domain-containing protein [Chitinophaga alhagiae]
MSATALKAAGLYLLLGCVWAGTYSSLWLSLAAHFPQVNPALLPYIMHAAFVTVSAVLVFVLVRNNSRQNNYRLLFYEHPLPMWIYEWGTLKFLAVNNAAIEKYGYSRKEFLGMTILDIRHPSTVNEVLEDVRKTSKQSVYRGVWQHQKKNREIFPVELYAHTTRYRGHEARLVMAVDIDAEIRSTVMAKDIGTRYELLAQVTPDYIYYWDMSADHVTRNHGPSSLFGYKEEEIMPHGNWWYEKIHPDDAETVQQRFQAALRSHTVQWSAEYRFRCANGQYKFVHDRGHIIYNEEGQPVRMIGAVQDITEKQQYVQQLQQQNAVLQDIARINSHEIRRPVASILGIMSMFDLDKNEPALNSRLLGLLQQSTAELDGLLHQIQHKLRSLNKQ